MKNEAIHNKDYSVVKTLRAGQLLTRSSFLGGILSCYGSA